MTHGGVIENLFKHDDAHTAATNETVILNYGLYMHTYNYPSPTHSVWGDTVVVVLV